MDRVLLDPDQQLNLIASFRFRLAGIGIFEVQVRLEFQNLIQIFLLNTLKILVQLISGLFKDPLGI